MLGSPPPIDDEIAAQHAFVDWRGGDDFRLELMVPAEQLGRGRERDDLHRGARHHQLGSVQRVQVVGRSRRA